MQIKIREAGEPDKPANKINNQIEVISVIKDHLGNTYNTFSEMCMVYKIGVDTVRFRLGLNWSLKDALETPVSEQNKPKKFRCKDHNNKMYDSVSEMCIAYGVTRTLYLYRLKKGWTQEDALTKPMINARHSGRKCGA